jgi:hypothetical protein
LKTTLEIELTRQISRPGDEITGHLHLIADSRLHARELTVSLQGEETVGANSINRSIIIPLVNEQRSFLSDKNAPGSQVPRAAEAAEESCQGQEKMCFPITFKLPDASPPSYASEIFKCLYFIKARLDIPWARDIIEKMHITVVPYETIGHQGKPAELFIERENLKVKVHIENDSLLAGDSLTGTFYMEHVPQEAPRSVNFELRALERSLEESYPFSRVLRSFTREIPLIDIDTGYTMAHFEFPLPADAPFSYRWNSFELLWEFSVIIKTFEDEELKVEKQILIKRMI